jgi:serine/threonine protein kinase
MPADSHLRILEVLEDALRLKPAARRALIERAFAGEPELAAEACSLLSHYEAVRRFVPGRAVGMCGLLPDTAAVEEVVFEAGRGWGVDPQPPFALDRFQVVRLLSKGGMGAVYLALDSRAGQPRAIKILRAGRESPRNIRRFALEAELLKRLRHPGLVCVFEAGRARFGRLWRPYLVMEYVAGEPLVLYLCRWRPDIQRRLRLLCEVCDAIEHAHHRGIVHCDLKPSNILVDFAGRARVLDFGVAQLCGLAEAHAWGAFVGTPGYACPEQLAGMLRRLTPQSDVYSLGLILHELLTGRLPRCVGGELRLDLGLVDASELAGADARRAADLRGELEAILRKCLAPDPGQRYQSAGALGQELRGLLDRLSATTVWSRFTRRLGRSVGRLPVWEPLPTGPALRAVLRCRVAAALHDAVDLPR